MFKLLDFILLPKTVYYKINNSRLFLYIGILFVGVLDIVFFQTLPDFLNLFISKPKDIFIFNLFMMLLSSVVIGIVDVLFFSIPMFDLLKFIKKEKLHKSFSMIKVAKVYILAHLVTLPASLIYYFIVFVVGLKVNFAVIFFMAIYGIVIILWFNGIIARGISVILRFRALNRILILLCIFLWNYLLGKGLGYIIENWIMRFFKAAI